jgi:hypothetical protein
LPLKSNNNLVFLREILTVSRICCHHPPRKLRPTISVVLGEKEVLMSTESSSTQNRVDMSQLMIIERVPVVIYIRANQRFCKDHLSKINKVLQNHPQHFKPTERQAKMAVMDDVALPLPLAEVVVT